MPIPHFSNPGISGLDELTSVEEAIVASIASLGTAGQVLAVNGTADGVEWVTGGGGGGTGDVVGPASAVDSNFAAFNTTTGKLIKDSGVSTSSFATAAQGTLADSALQFSDIGVSIQAYSAVLAATTASFTTADETKLDGIEASADVTDATNVSAAGAPIISSGAGAPASIPTKVGDIYIDTTGDDAYIAVGTASSADWEKSNDGTGSGGTLDQTYDFGGAGAGRSITADSGAVEITVPDTSNNTALIINQNDTTSNSVGLYVSSPGVSYPVVIESTGSTTLGAFLQTYHNSSSPAAGDYIGGIDFYGKTSTAAKQAYAYFNAKIVDSTAGAEYGSFVVEIVRNGAIGGAGEQMLEVGAESDSAINGISVGFDTAAGVVSSRGNQDLILQTGNTTTGIITITDGANGNINLAPNGTGRVQAGGVNIPTVSSTDTLTNKNITKRTGTTTSSATPTINTDNVDEYYITAQAVDITSFTTNLSGTPTLGQTLYISIKGTAARSITWGASFTNGVVALPTTTTTTLELMTLFKWNGTSWAAMATGSTV